MFQKLEELYPTKTGGGWVIDFSYDAIASLLALFTLPVRSGAKIGTQKKHRSMGVMPPSEPIIRDVNGWAKYRLEAEVANL